MATLHEIWLPCGFRSREETNWAEECNPNATRVYRPHLNSLDSSEVSDPLRSSFSSRLFKNEQVRQEYPMRKLSSGNLSNGKSRSLINLGSGNSPRSSRKILGMEGTYRRSNNHGALGNGTTSPGYARQVVSVMSLVVPFISIFHARAAGAIH
jgi:hypothetical protein